VDSTLLLAGTSGVLVVDSSVSLDGVALLTMLLEELDSTEEEDSSLLDDDEIGTDEDPPVEVGTVELSSIEEDDSVDSESETVARVLELEVELKLDVEVLSSCTDLVVELGTTEAVLSSLVLDVVSRVDDDEVDGKVALDDVLLNGIELELALEELAGALDSFPELEADEEALLLLRVLLVVGTTDEEALLSDATMRELDEAEELGLELDLLDDD